MRGGPAMKIGRAQRSSVKGGLRLGLTNCIGKAKTSAVKIAGSLTRK
jgi:hypothetical protein